MMIYQLTTHGAKLLMVNLPNIEFRRCQVDNVV